MKKTNKVLIGSMLVNIFLIIIKVFIGIIGNSKTLIAHGIHSLSDLITDIVAIFGNVLANKPADSKHPYGHGRIEYLTSIIVGCIIIILSSTLIFEAFTKVEKMPENIVIIVSFITLIIKYSYAKYMHIMGNKYQNSILIASATESKADALTSIFVVISVLLAKLNVYNEIFKYSDNICTFIIGAYIFYIGFKIISENIINIIGHIETDEDYLNIIKNIILKNDEVLDLCKLNILKYGSYNTIDLEIAMDKDIRIKESNVITNKIKKELLNKKNKITHVNIVVIPYQERK